MNHRMESRILLLCWFSLILHQTHIFQFVSLFSTPHLLENHFDKFLTFLFKKEYHFFSSSSSHPLKWEENQPHLLLPLPPSSPYVQDAHLTALYTRLPPPYRLSSTPSFALSLEDPNLPTPSHTLTASQQQPRYKSRHLHTNIHTIP